MVLQEKIDRIRYNDPSVLTIVEDESSQFLAVLRSAGGRYVSIDFEMGYILEGIVEDVDEDTRQVTLSSVFEYDPFDMSGFYYDVCWPTIALTFEKIGDALLIAVKPEQAKSRYLIDSCHLQEKEDPQKLENLTDDQLFAFLQFQALVPSCRLHGSTVYGLSTPNSDVDICVEDSDLLDSADINWKFGVTLFDVVQDLTNQPLSRVILQHDNGTEIDIVGMRHYHEEKDIVIQRICEVVEFKEFFESVQTWWKRCDHFRSVDGYPNKFNVFLTGIFFL